MMLSVAGFNPLKIDPSFLLNGGTEPAQNSSSILKSQRLFSQLSKELVVHTATLSWADLLTSLSEE